MLWIASANESLTGFTRDKDIKSSSAPHYFLSQSFAPSSAMFKIERLKLFICCGKINNYLDAPSYIRSWGWESLCGKRWKFKNRFVPMHISSWWPQQSCLICNDCGHTFEITVCLVGWLFCVPLLRPWISTERTNFDEVNRLLFRRVVAKQ